MAGHPSGDPKIVREHIDKQRKGDEELAESPGPPPESRDTSRRKAEGRAGAKPSKTVRGR